MGTAKRGTGRSAAVVVVKAVALVLAIPALVLAFFALAWTEVPQALAAMSLGAAAAALWWLGGRIRPRSAT